MSTKNKYLKLEPKEEEEKKKKKESTYWTTPCASAHRHFGQ